MLEPLFNTVIIKRDEKEFQTKTGILIAETVAELKSIGTVKAVGAGIYNENGTFIPTIVKEGDRVMFPNRLGQEIEFDNEEFVILKETDIIGIIK